MKTMKGNFSMGVISFAKHDSFESSQNDNLTFCV